MGSRATEYPSSVRAVGFEPRDTLLPRRGRERGEPGVDALDRRAVPAHAVLRQPKHDDLAVPAREQRESKTDPAAHAIDGLGGHLPQAAYKPEGRRSPDLPVFAAECEDRASEPGLEHGHHVHSDGSRLHVPGGDPRLVQSVRPVVAAFQQPGKQFLRRGPGGVIVVAATGDLQLGPGSSIHQLCIHVGAGGRRRGDQHGRSWTRVRQHFCGASLEDGQVREHLLEGLRERAGASAGSERVPGLLLLRAFSPIARKPDAVGCVQGSTLEEGTTATRERSTSRRCEEESVFSHLVRAHASAAARPLGRGSRSAKPHWKSCIRGLSYFVSSVVLTMGSTIPPEFWKRIRTEDKLTEALSNVIKQLSSGKPVDTQPVPYDWVIDRARNYRFPEPSENLSPTLRAWKEDPLSVYPPGLPSPKEIERRYAAAEVLLTVDPSKTPSLTKAQGYIDRLEELGLNERRPKRSQIEDPNEREPTSARVPDSPALFPKSSYLLRFSYVPRVVPQGNWVFYTFKQLNEQGLRIVKDGRHHPSGLFSEYYGLRSQHGRLGKELNRWVQFAKNTNSMSKKARHARTNLKAVFKRQFSLRREMEAYSRRLPHFAYPRWDAITKN